VQYDPTMDITDRLELHELPGRYGDIIDDRNWPALATIFTEDATFDLTDLGSRKLFGLADIQGFMDTEAQHPRMHLMTNIYADEGPTGVTLRSRIVTVLPNGKVGTGSYYDDVVKTADGWRIKDRVVTVRRQARS
jgi:SnoaL-like domain